MRARQRAVDIKLPTATMKSHRVASADAPVIDGESIACSNEPSSLVTYRAAYRHCQREYCPQHSAVETPPKPLRTPPLSTARVQLAALSCRAALRHERQVGNASNH